MCVCVCVQKHIHLCTGTGMGIKREKERERDMVVVAYVCMYLPTLPYPTVRYIVTPPEPSLTDSYNCRTIIKKNFFWFWSPSFPPLECMVGPVRPSSVQSVLDSQIRSRAAWGSCRGGRSFKSGYIYIYIYKLKKKA